MRRKMAICVLLISTASAYAVELSESTKQKIVTQVEAYGNCIQENLEKGLSVEVVEVTCHKQLLIDSCTRITCQEAAKQHSDECNLHPSDVDAMCKQQADYMMNLAGQGIDKASEEAEVAVAATSECGFGKVIYRKAFSDPSWGLSADDLEGDSLVIKPSPGRESLVVNPTGPYEDGSVCVDYAITESDDVGETAGGLVFWAVDGDNYYTFKVSRGDFTVERQANGKRLIPIDWTIAKPANKAQGETNTLEVVLEGKTATFLVNGEQVGKVTGVPPEGGGLVGVTAQSPPNSSATLKFTNFVVTEAPAQ